MGKKLQSGNVWAIKMTERMSRSQEEIVPPKSRKKKKDEMKGTCAAAAGTCFNQSGVELHVFHFFTSTCRHQFRK